MAIAGLQRAPTSESPGVLTEFALGFQQATPDWRALNDFLTAKFPDAEDTLQYGEDFEALTTEARLDRIRSLRAAELREKYADIDVARWSDTWAAQLGKIAGTFATPTTLIPALAPVKTMKGLAVLGGALGSAESVVQQLGRNGQIDPAETAITGMIGAAAVPAVLKAMQLGDVAGGKLITAVATSNIRRASSTVDDFQRALDIARINNRGPLTESLRQQVVSEAERMSGIPFEQVVRAGQAVKRAPILRSVKEAKEMLQQTPMGLAGTKPMSGIAKVLQPIMDRTKDHSPQLWGRMIKMEARAKINTHTYIKGIKPFAEAFRKLPSEQRTQASLALFNGDFRAAERFLGAPAMKSIRDVLGNIQAEAQKSGIRLSKEQIIKNYFPRNVKDFDGLVNFLDMPRRKGLQAMIQKAEQTKGAALSEGEMADVVESFLHGSPYKLAPMPGALRDRTIEKLNPGLIKFYETADASIIRHIRHMVSEIEKRNFFGKGAKLHAGTGAVDVRTSARETLAGLGRLDPIAQRELQAMLEARFTMADSSPAKWIQHFRNYSYAGYLGNPLSAMVQTGDALLSFPVNGVRATLGGMFGKRALKAVDVGLEDLAHELSVSASTSARFMEGAFKYGGFKAVDLFGKTIHLNSALRSMYSKAATEGGRRALTREFGQAFAQEWPQLLSDLSSKRLTEGVKVLLMARLAKTQPIFASSMPLLYLNHPNGRLLYMLHTFSLRLVNTVYRDGIREIARGNYGAGAKAMFGLTSALMAGGVTVDIVQDMLKGREIKPETIGISALDNFLKVWGGSEYLLNLAQKGRFESVISELALPPLGIIAALGQDAVETAKQGELPQTGLRSSRYVPVVGQMYYWWFGRGAEIEHEKRYGSLGGGLPSQTLNTGF